MIPSDISLLPILGRPTISGDGRFAVVSVSRVDLAADEGVHELWLADTSGTTPARLLTKGPYDGAPAFSPDGRWLAFLRPAPGGPAQLHLLPMDGGDPVVVTDQPLGAGQPVWSPDSRRIAYCARVGLGGRYRRGVPPQKEAPRRITKLRYMADGFGYWFDRPRQVFVTDPFTPDHATVQITDSEHDHGDIDWSPDGSLLTFVAARHATHGDDLRNDVWVAASDGTGDLRALTEGGLTLGCPRFAKDGSAVCFAAEVLDEHQQGVANSSYGLWSAPVDGTAGPRRLTDPEPYHLSYSSQMIATGREGVYFANDHRGEVNLILVPYDGGEPTPVITGERQVNGYAVAEGAHGVTIAAVVADAGSAGDLMVWHNGEERTLTGFGAALRATGRIRPAEEFTAVTADGYPLQGWIVRPEGEGPHPVLLQIKGGPFTQWGYTLNGPASFEEAQVYAGAGYAVVLGNPRGAAGYGQAHGKHILDDLPRRTAEDLLALLETALEAPDLDGGRVGMMGGSFGGYMSAWMAAHHGKHFNAAIAERGCYAIDSHSASSDEGIILSLALYGTDPEVWRDASPLTHADQIDIPVLLIQSEEDRHTPMEQAQRLFVALKRRGVPVEMLLFPGETHEMSRTGLPSHRLARYEAVLEWWARHL